MDTNALLVALEERLAAPGEKLVVTLAGCDVDPWESGADRVVAVLIGEHNPDRPIQLRLLDQHADEPGVVVEQCAEVVWQGSWVVTLGARQVSEWG